MEGEINNFIMVWITVLASLAYCHTVDKIFPKGYTRCLAILPVICLFFYLPLNLTSIHLGGTTSFFIAWLASFKLILFAFCKGPLYSNPPIPLSRFIPLACLPIRFSAGTEGFSSQETKKKSQKSPTNYVTKIILLVILIRVYDYKNYIHHYIILFCYCLHIYFMLEMILAMVATLARVLTRVELEPQFDEPYLATSLQDFWGRRWNLMVSNILRPTVYDPVLSISKRVMARKWAVLPAVLATFLVSGLMHELVFYNIGRLKPTGEVMCFFLLHGVSLAMEIGIKKVLKGRFTLPWIVSGPLTLAYVMTTSFWLFFPPFLRGNADLKGCTESIAFIESVKNHRLVSPNNVTCPFL
ncbi:Acyl-CoA--sterol O-acyltransferase 1 [Abeliophyllum distichum]|uniref:Acyl-CoA--sterol O-acyltransferase 1 n=1 Tax=Abeliophyllum distichum TaxID=126358 RepID=A0ABD1QHK9_9LAMI